MAELDRERIGNRLKRLRGDRTQQEIANAIGVSDAAVSAYEAGERMPRDDVKVRIAKIFGKTVNEIFFEKENNET